MDMLSILTEIHLHEYMYFQYSFSGLFNISMFHYMYILPKNKWGRKDEKEREGDREGAAAAAG